MEKTRAKDFCSKNSTESHHEVVTLGGSNIETIKINAKLLGEVFNEILLWDENVHHISKMLSEVVGIMMYNPRNIFRNTIPYFPLNLITGSSLRKQVVKEYHYTSYATKENKLASF